MVGEFAMSLFLGRCAHSLISLKPQRFPTAAFARLIEKCVTLLFLLLCTVFRGLELSAVLGTQLFSSYFIFFSSLFWWFIVACGNSPSLLHDFAQTWQSRRLTYPGTIPLKWSLDNSSVRHNPCVNCGSILSISDSGYSLVRWKLVLYFFSGVTMTTFITITLNSEWPLSP